MQEENKIYFVVNSESKVLENTIAIDEEVLNSEDWEYDPMSEVVYLFIESSSESVYCAIGECEYIVEDEMFQPIVAPSDTWTKNENGTWIEMFDRPSTSHKWEEALEVWIDTSES